MQGKITYKAVGVDVRVYLDGRLVGAIKRSTSGWYYQPKGSKTKGEPNHSLAEVKRSLEVA